MGNGLKRAKAAAKKSRQAKTTGASKQRNPFPALRTVKISGPAYALLTQLQQLQTPPKPARPPTISDVIESAAQAHIAMLTTPHVAALGGGIAGDHEPHAALSMLNVLGAKQPEIPGVTTPDVESAELPAIIVTYEAHDGITYATTTFGDNAFSGSGATSAGALVSLIEEMKTLIGGFDPEAYTFKVGRSTT